MKTIKNTFALLFAVLSFAACTDQTIEPAKPAYPSQLGIVRPDTTVTGPVQLTTENDDNQLKAVQPRTSVSGEQPGRSPFQLASVDSPEPVDVPRPVEVPRPAVMPVIALDSLAQ